MLRGKCHLQESTPIQRGGTALSTRIEGARGTIRTTSTAKVRPGSRFAPSLGGNFLQAPRTRPSLGGDRQQSWERTLNREECRSLRGKGQILEKGSSKERGYFLDEGRRGFACEGDSTNQESSSRTAFSGKKKKLIRKGREGRIGICLNSEMAFEYRENLLQ